MKTKRRKIMKKNKTISFFKNNLIKNYNLNEKEVFLSYYDYIYKRKSSYKKVRLLRNRAKLVRLFINEQNMWYILLDKDNKNLHIYGEVRDLKTNY